MAHTSCDTARNPVGTGAGEAQLWKVQLGGRRGCGAGEGGCKGHSRGGGGGGGMVWHERCDQETILQCQGLAVEGTMVLWLCKPLSIRLLTQHSNASSECSQSYGKQVSC